MANNTFTPEALHAFAERILRKAGATAEDGAIIADTLVCADLRGIHSHGVGKIGDYLRRIEAGVLDPAARAVVAREKGVTVRLDARNGFGQVAARRAMEMAMARAETHGVGLALVGNSNHFGIASYYALLAAERNLVGVSVSDSSPGIAPFGAKEKLFGTNPVSIAVPTATHFPLVLDMSSSVVARGKVKQAEAAGSDIPLGWARDRDGVPTTDPVAALKGTLEPIGGPKGSGIALMIEVLCGVLAGSTLPGEVRIITDTGGPCGTAHLLAAVDPDSFVDRASFLADMDACVERIKSLTPIAGEIFVPGEIEHRATLKARKDGIVLKDGAVRNLTAVGERYGVALEG